MYVHFLFALVVCFCAVQSTADTCNPSSCIADNDCSGICCGGRCVELGYYDNIGASCSASDSCVGKCGKALECNPFGVCALQDGRGLPYSCPCTTDAECGFGGFCRLDKTCALGRIRNGKACMDPRECISKKCSSRKCVAATAGQTCDSWSDADARGGCDVGLTCMTSVCVPSIPEGGACTVASISTLFKDACAEGSMCVRGKCTPEFQGSLGLCEVSTDFVSYSTLCKGFCVEILDPPVCLRKRDAGEICYNPNECGDNLTCQDNSCTSSLALSCTTDDVCASNQECNCESPFSRCAIPSYDMMQTSQQCSELSGFDLTSISETPMRHQYYSPSASGEEKRTSASFFCCMAFLVADFCSAQFIGYNIDCATTTIIPIDLPDRCSTTSAIGGVINCDQARLPVLSASPTVAPSLPPSLLPTVAPSLPPSLSPTVAPSLVPVLSASPTVAPSRVSSLCVALGAAALALWVV